MILENFSNPIINKYVKVLNNNNIDIAGIEFLEDEEGKLYTYDINTNTNYNNTAEKLTKYDGMKSIAEYLYGEFKLL